MRSLVLGFAMLAACGDDGTNVPDAASGGALSIEPASIRLAPGETVTATVKLDHVVTGTALAFVIIGEAADVIVSDGAIDTGASSHDITLAAKPTAAAGMFTITAMGFADSDVTSGRAVVTVVP